MGADLADMQLLSKFNQGIRFFLCVLDIYSKYAWVVPLKNKKGIMFTKNFKWVRSQTKQNMGRQSEWILQQID